MTYKTRYWRKDKWEC